MPRQIRLELLPRERAALLKGNFTIDEVLAQLEACAASEDVETIRMTAVDIHFLASDLTHAIVKRGCRDQDIIDLSERLDYVDDTSDASLAGWYD
jgi:ribulose bisphosphate carboxylase small subunit